MNNSYPDDRMIVFLRQRTAHRTCNTTNHLSSFIQHWQPHLFTQTTLHQRQAYLFIQNNQYTYQYPQLPVKETLRTHTLHRIRQDTVHQNGKQV